MCEVTHGGVFFSKITLTIKRKLSLLGSQAVKLMSVGQIAVPNEEDLQYFWQILISVDFDTNTSNSNTSNSNNSNSNNKHYMEVSPSHPK